MSGIKGQRKTKESKRDYYVRTLRPVIKENQSDHSLLLKRLRLDSGMSAHDLAKKAGCSTMSVCRVENGVRNPSPELLGRMLVYLNAPFDDCAIEMCRYFTRDWLERLELSYFGECEKVGMNV